MAADPAVRSGSGTSQAPIVVGLDGSQAAAEALRWAAGQSQLTGSPVVAVHAYQSPDSAVPDSTDVRQAHESHVRAQATRWLRDAMSESSALPWQTRLEVAVGAPRRVLAERAQGASMLVVGRTRHDPPPAGARPRGRARLRCPLVTVPTPDPGAPAPPGEADLPRRTVRRVGGRTRTTAPA
ncbi:MAG: universal stress protein [Nocardioidaceae bacterium]